MHRATIQRRSARARAVGRYILLRDDRGDLRRGVHGASQVATERATVQLRKTAHEVEAAGLSGCVVGVERRHPLPGVSEQSGVEERDFLRVHRVPGRADHQSEVQLRIVLGSGTTAGVVGSHDPGDVFLHLVDPDPIGGHPFHEPLEDLGGHAAVLAGTPNQLGAETVVELPEHVEHGVVREPRLVDLELRGSDRTTNEEMHRRHGPQVRDLQSERASGEASTDDRDGPIEAGLLHPQLEIVDAEGVGVDDVRRVLLAGHVGNAWSDGYDDALRVETHGAAQRPSHDGVGAVRLHLVHEAGKEVRHEVVLANRLPGEAVERTERRRLVRIDLLPSQEVGEAVLHGVDVRHAVAPERLEGLVSGEPRPVAHRGLGVHHNEVLETERLQARRESDAVQACSDDHGVDGLRVHHFILLSHGHFSFC